MNISRKELKFNAKQILANKSMLIVVTLVYTIASAAALGLGVFLNFIPFIGAILYLGIAFAVLAFSFQITKANMDATNDVEIDVFNFEKLKKAIFTALWTLLYILPGFVLYMIGFMILFVGMIASIFMQSSDINTFAPASTTPVSPLLFIISMILIIIGIVYLVVIEYSLFFAIHMVYDGNKYDHLSAKEIVKECKQMMKGHKFELFVLDLSFIGWAFVLGLVSAIPLLGWIASFIGTAVLTVYIALTQIQFYKAIAPVQTQSYDTLNMYKE